jgi:hypothetical protein
VLAVSTSADPSGGGKLEDRPASDVAPPAGGGLVCAQRRQVGTAAPAGRRLGAGAGLRAGVPVVPVPVVADQPFWAARLARVGVSLGAVRFKHLSAERLAALIRQAVGEPPYRQRA